MASERGPRRVPIEVPNGELNVYANAKVARALEEVTEDMTVYHGVRLAEVLEAVHEQGVRDGRREVFEHIDEVKNTPELKHRNPGRPAKKPAPRKTPPKKA